jgi:hypothetical protein
MPKYKADLYNMAAKWEEEARKDSRDSYPYTSLLDELFFHAELRFKDYRQYQEEGAFSKRLSEWICNIPEESRRKTLVKLLRYLLFIDRMQMESIYRDAYRRIIGPWLSAEWTNPSLFLAPDLEIKLLRTLKQFTLLSITESMCFSDFLNANDLSGLRKPAILGEGQPDFSRIIANSKAKGAIVLEDFVGTGKQASATLAHIATTLPTTWKLLFVPLIILECGLNAMRADTRLTRITISPVITVSANECIHDDWVKGEQADFCELRTVIQETAERVLERLNDMDDPPDNAFGYKGSGAFVVTCHNAPNNTLPLIHHRAPTWSPLFRRIHHSKDGL